MKKFFSSILIAGLVLTIGTASAFAVSSQSKKSNDARYMLTNCAGANGSVVCGNRSDESVCPQDGTGCKNGNGNAETNFVDANNDGVCDNRADESVCPQDGTGCKNGNGNAETNFVDANNDGVCDNRADGGVCPQDETGAGRGGRNR
jgi:hypothetical protein